MHHAEELVELAAALRAEGREKAAGLIEGRVNMCLSNAYRKDDHSLLMSNTSRIEVDGDIIRLRDLFGSVREIKGSIVSTDFEKNEIEIRVDE